MSRSRKKHPVVSDYSRSKNGTKLDKRLASKQVRNHDGFIPDGCHYKLFYNSWNIHDYKWYMSVSEEYKKHPEYKSDDYRFTTYEDVEKYKRK